MGHESTSSKLTSNDTHLLFRINFSYVKSVLTPSLAFFDFRDNIMLYPDLANVRPLKRACVSVSSPECIG